MARSAPSSPPAGVDAWSAWLRYDDAARDLLTALKNGQRRDLVAWFAGGLASVLPVPAATVVTWAPTGAARRRRRGFDQAELLARALARRWGLPCHGLLDRLPGPPQAGRGAADRRSNPAFGVRRPVAGSVVVVDDVATTGATVAAAARALRRGGAGRVEAVVVARAATPIAR